MTSLKAGVLPAGSIALIPLPLLTSITVRLNGKAYECLQCRSKGNISGGARDCRRREPLGGSGGMLPQKILESKGLEMLFPAFSKSYL